jgi:hypothetical protein
LATADRGYLTPVVKVTSGVEENSLVIFLTWSSIAEKPASKAIEEEISASEGEVPVLESSYCSIPMVSGNKRSREPLIKSVLKKQNSTTSAEQNKGYVIVGISEWEEMVGIIGGALRDSKESVGRLHLIFKKDPNIRELADSFNSKADSFRENLDLQIFI